MGGSLNEHRFCSISLLLTAAGNSLGEPKDAQSAPKQTSGRIVQGRPRFSSIDPVFKKTTSKTKRANPQLVLEGFSPQMCPGAAQSSCQQQGHLAARGRPQFLPKGPRPPQVPGKIVAERRETGWKKVNPKAKSPKPKAQNPKPKA